MIEPTKDMAIVNKILKSGGIWENIGGKGSREDFEAPTNDDIHYLRVTHDGEDAGLFILHPGEYGLKIHANMLPEFRGKIALQAAADALDFAFQIDDTIYAEIPEEFENVVTFASYFLKPVSTEGGVHKLQLTKNEWLGG